MKYITLITTPEGVMIKQLKPNKGTIDQISASALLQTAIPLLDRWGSRVATILWLRLIQIHIQQNLRKTKDVTI